jgi:hypothetical protein
MLGTRLVEVKTGKSKSEISRLWKMTKSGIDDVKPKSSDWYLIAMRKFKSLIK